MRRNVFNTTPIQWRKLVNEVNLAHYLSAFGKAMLPLLRLHKTFVNFLWVKKTVQSVSWPNYREITQLLCYPLHEKSYHSN